MEELSTQASAVLLLSLRIAPALGFAPPFTLVKLPGIVRMMLGISLAAWLVASSPKDTWQAPFLANGFLAAAMGELFLGIALALALQLAFAALLTAGRTIDVQAGFGLAAVVDPTTRNQMPLVGMIFAYAAAAVFFAMGAPHDLLAIWAASVETIPLGRAVIGGDPAALIEYIGAVFVMAMGLAGLALIVLFLLDLIIAFLSRTLPQMNVLLLGFQAKAVATIAILPLALALSGAVFVKLMRFALETAPQLMGG